MPSKEVATERPSKLDFSRTVGPPRDEQLTDVPLGRLGGDKPAYDTAMGAKPAVGPAPDKPPTKRFGRRNK